MGPLQLTQRMKFLSCFSPCSYSKAKHIFLRHIANAKKYSYSPKRDTLPSANDALINQILRPSLSRYFAKEAVLKPPAPFQLHPVVIQHALKIVSTLISRPGHKSTENVLSILSNGKNDIMW